MTLNITIMTPDVLYQSADFRLTNLDNGGPMPHKSHKIVSLSYPDWAGYVTYTGLGRWGEKDTSDWVVEWLENNDSLGPDEVVALLAERIGQDS